MSFRTKNKLCNLLNLIEQNSDADVDSEIIADILEKMRMYSSSQFPKEEAQMRKLDYPNFSPHKQDHRDFLQKVCRLCVDATHHKKTVPKDIHEFLSKWQTDHINTSDTHFKFFKENKSLLSNLM